MQIDGLELENFRNYDRAEAEFDSRCNVICGENAQGKTNLLESLRYLSCGRSQRTRTDRDMITFQRDQASVAARVFARDREFLVRAELFRDRRRKFSINRVAAKNAAALSEVFQTVFFCPEDLLLIREGAAVRRRFLDGALCQLRPRYAAALADYNRAYEHKTRILRDAEERPDLLELLPEFNRQLVQRGAVLIHYRAQFTEKLAVCAAENHFLCSGEKERLEISYQTVSAVSDPLAPLPEVALRLEEHMERHQRAELASRLCLSGPHKDDLSVCIDGRDAKQFSSQGQTRTAALAIKLAEREIFKNVMGEFPILLLDDVLSELDPKRQEFVLNRIDGGQVFITCCEEDRLPQLLGGRVFHVKQGRIET